MKNNKNRVFAFICALSIILTGCKGAGSDNEAKVEVTNQSNSGNMANGNDNQQIYNDGNNNNNLNVIGDNNTLFQADNITVYIDGALTTLKNINGEEVSPIIYNHEIYFPITAVSEEIKTPIQYDSETGAVYVGDNPKGKTNMLDVINAYDTQEFRQYSFLKSGGVERFEMAGKKYVDGAVLRAWRNHNAFAHFGLDGKYKSFTFRINHIDGSKMVDVLLRIYVDGVVKFEETIGASDYLKPYEINIRNALQLKIEMINNDYSETSYGMIEMMLEPK